MPSEDVIEALINLKLAEKRLSKLIEESERRERALGRKLIRAIMAKDYQQAKTVAREILALRRKKRAAEGLLARIRDLRGDLEVASAIQTYSEGLKKARKLIERAGYDVEKILLVGESLNLDDILELTGERVSVDELAVEELLEKAEKLALKEIEEELPAVDLEEVVEVEREREG